MTSHKPTLAITPGEPAGIGPDLALSLYQRDFNANLVFIADQKLLKERAAQLGMNAISFNVMSEGREPLQDLFNLIPLHTNVPVVTGQPDPDNAAYVLACLARAVSLCQSGQCDGMVTGPVNKAVISDSGINFTGHTEWLAEQTNTGQVVMMLATPELRVALATTHLPLRDVADAITVPSLLKTIEIIHQDLQRLFAIAAPRILVCGLNPHAGESGHLGREEIDTIIPAINLAREASIDVIGPMPADTAFTPENLARADVVLAMYHDQGLPVLKYAGFNKAINITLGLPIIRTSVDHGTAIDLAGTGKANSDSMIAAINHAAELARHKVKAS